jgi:hypothetical protein
LLTESKKFYPVIGGIRIDVQKANTSNPIGDLPVENSKNKSQKKKKKSGNEGADLENSRVICSIAKGKQNIYGLTTRGEIFKFENSTWTQVLPNITFSNPSIACSNDTLYVADIGNYHILYIKKYVNNIWVDARKIGDSYSKLIPDKVNLINDGEDLYLLISGLGGMSIYTLIGGNWINLGLNQEKKYPEDFYCSGGIPFLNYRYYDAEFKDHYSTSFFNGIVFKDLCNLNSGGKNFISVYGANIYALFNYPIKDNSKYNTEYILSMYINKNWRGVTRDSIMLPPTFYAVNKEKNRLQISYFNEPFNGTFQTKSIYYKANDIGKDTLNQENQKIDTLTYSIVNRIRKYLKIYSYENKTSSIIFNPETRVLIFMDATKNIYYSFNIDKVLIYKQKDSQAGYNLIVECENKENCIETYDLSTHQKKDDTFGFFFDIYINEIADKMVSDFQLLKSSFK